MSLSTSIPMLLAAEDIAVVAVVGGMLLAAGAMFMKHRQRVKHIEEVEASRREIAAYVAEGTMTPADGERLMNAGPQPPKE